MEEIKHHPQCDQKPSHEAGGIEMCACGLPIARIIPISQRFGEDEGKLIEMY